MIFQDSTLEFARNLDKLDELAGFRNEFRIPTTNDVRNKLGEPEILSEKEVVYLCGNSLGLCPKKAVVYVNRELEKWGRFGVMGHLKGELPWVSCEDPPTEILASLLGCQQDEVVVMNNLTANIHLFLSSFYLPDKTRFKIAIEGDAFPSDHYALESHLRLHGFNEKEALVIFRPRPGEDLLKTEDIVAKIEEEGEKLALIFISPVHFRTGQFFDISPIVEASHRVGAFIGLDLAHALGNVPLYLSKWRVDFACACSYKYLNAGPGGIGVCYVNRAHFNRKQRLIGWFAHTLETRFVMNNKIDLEAGASGFKTGNQSPLLCASLIASLEIFRSAGGIERLRKKSLLLTGYLEWLLTKSDLFSDFPKNWGSALAILTPKDPNQRGCQLSIRIPDPPGVDTVEKELEKRGVLCDVRRPDIVRVAPVPLYNSFEDVHRFAVIFRDIFCDLFKKPHFTNTFLEKVL